jgi:hypothetical protein
MKESHREGLASHPGPESCVVGREAEREARTGVQTGRAIELRKRRSRVPTPSGHAEGHTDAIAIARARSARRSRRTLAHVWKLPAWEPGDPGGAGGVRTRRPERESDEP